MILAEDEQETQDGDEVQTLGAETWQGNEQRELSYNGNPQFPH